MNEQEILNIMKLSLLPRLGATNAKFLLEQFGSATELFNNISYIKDYLPDASDLLIETLNKHSSYMARAEEELEFADSQNINCICLGSTDYPYRMKDCDDAPIIMYYLGNADLNKSKIISIVGTRHCTEYGKELCSMLIKQLKEQISNLIIVSGLAYGIDIEAHKNALANNYETIGVLAHGLDQIYPPRHRPVAVEMVKQGGLLTEFMSKTFADKFNFVKRNRIVAGLSDATIVIESKEKGGSLITADIAESYHRDVCAFPGRIYDDYSKGCNMLIRNNKASMITCADDLIELMRWGSTGNAKKKAVQQELFIELSDDEKLICKSLKNCDSKQINQIAVETNMPIQKVSISLFELEMKGIVKSLNGGNYKLIQL